MLNYFQSMVWIRLLRRVVCIRLLTLKVWNQFYNPWLTGFYVFLLHKLKIFLNKVICRRFHEPNLASFMSYYLAEHCGSPVAKLLVD